ncbi:hypothetical protein [Streptomyces mesophilus]|uniref:hypothetical protein n=1 Tax=Streptomyces mesophilus TaxID=1775132 RepID=UPI003319E071
MTSPVNPHAQVCRYCNGFASVAVSSGGRDQRGHLRTITIDCPTCLGFGTLPVQPRPTASAWEVAA